MRRVLFLFVFVCLSSTLFGQGLRFGIGGGLSMVTAPASFTEAVNAAGNAFTGGAGFGTEFNVAVKVKLGLPVVPFKPIGFLQYHFLNSSMDTPFGTFEASMNILTLGVGGELSLIPGPLSPYVGADITYNNFMDGKIEGPAPIGTHTFSASGSRMGIGIGAGVELNLMVISLDLNAKYNMLNLIAKEEGEGTVGIFTVDLFLFF